MTALSDFTTSYIRFPEHEALAMPRPVGISQSRLQDLVLLTSLSPGQSCVHLQQTRPTDHSLDGDHKSDVSTRAQKTRLKRHTSATQYIHRERRLLLFVRAQSRHSRWTTTSKL